MTHAISAEGLALIQEFEGFRAIPVPTPDGAWVVGHGHLRTGAKGKRVTRKEAAELLARDLAPVESLVNAKVKPAITQAQFDALVSFAFSIGADEFAKSQVLRRVNACQFVAAACAMEAWRKSDISGDLEIAAALVRRRTAEKALLLKDVPHETAPSVLLRAKLDRTAPVLGAPRRRATKTARRADPGKRLTEILKSEPATEAVLLMSPAVALVEPAEEIATAHAKPVSRRVQKAPRASQPGHDKGATWESFGLVVLLGLGLGMISIGATLLFDGGGRVFEIVAAGVLAAPGVAVALIASLALWRAPQAEEAA